jgi:DNA modification methylase
VTTYANRCMIGDCRDSMRQMIADGVRVQMCVTSPPYWGLRDYGSPGQIGLEPTIRDYVDAMVGVFGLVRELLADDGTLWLNMGDCYAGSWGAQSREHAGKHAPNVSALSANQVKAAQIRNGTSSLCRTPGLKPKDLIGVPWRVAFALQQPWERATIKDRIDRAWLAALVDGEGCMTIMQAQNGEKSATSFPPVLQVKMCDPECIEKANQITGFEQCLRQDSPSRGGTRDTYQWRITGRRAADIAAEIYPFLLIKRKQATILWNHQMTRDSYETKRGQPMPPAAREKQIVCRQLIQRLNQKQPIDLPSWMVEPSINVEPGWYLRQDVIWHKPNPMPESVTDRCTKAHEYLFLLSKSERYYFDADAISEPVNGNAHSRGNGVNPKAAVGEIGREKQNASFSVAVRELVSRRNKRSVWTIASDPYSDAHFATFPPALVEPCILAGSRAGDVVLDPFFGSGTVGEVAQRLGRKWIGCDLQKAYAPLQARRTAQQGFEL